MNVEFSSNKLRKQLTSAKEIKKTFGVNAKRVQQRMDEIDASPNLAVLKKIPAANCHMLTGNRAGEWGLDISKNHRLIFEIDHDPVPKTGNNEIDAVRVTDIMILGEEDYH
jgi:plasmid maintenance system killer protein